MSPRTAIERQLDFTLKSTDFPSLGTLYRGKVRDVYAHEDRLVLITTDRVSAFDHVLGTIPFKGEILNALAREGFDRTRDIVPHHVLQIPDPSVVVGRRCRAYPVEFVVRGYITGSLWRDYEAGQAYGIDLPKGLQKNQRLDAPILTPTTKAARGAHDQPISPAEIVRRELMTTPELERATEVALRLFARGQATAEERGLILVDTKYELGEDPDGQLTLLDEVHTPDSSRFWIAREYEARFAERRPQNMLDKENLRAWLIDRHGFSGQGTPPALDREIRMKLSERYMEAHALLLGRPFVPSVGDVRSRIETSLAQAGLL